VTVLAASGGSEVFDIAVLVFGALLMAGRCSLGWRVARSSR
jgi:hypothetical protein